MCWTLLLQTREKHIYCSTCNVKGLNHYGLFHRQLSVFHFLCFVLRVFTQSKVCSVRFVYRNKTTQPLTQPRRTVCTCLCPTAVLQPHLIMASWVRDVTSLNQVQELFFLRGVSVASPCFFTLWKTDRPAGWAPNSVCPGGFYKGNGRWPFLFHPAWSRLPSETNKTKY